MLFEFTNVGWGACKEMGFSWNFGSSCSTIGENSTVIPTHIPFRANFNDNPEPEKENL